MGSRNPERDRPPLSPGATLAQLMEQSPGWVLLARCRQCALHGDLIDPRKLVAKYGESMTLGNLAARLRCGQCGGRGADLQPRFLGKRRD